MVVELTIIVLGFTIAFIIEARHDYILALKEALIDKLLSDVGEEQEQQLLKQEWHRKDWLYLFVISIIISYLYSGISISSLLILVIISTLKILVFNIRINALLNTNLFYLSDSGFESKFKGKEKLYYASALSLFIASIITIICIN